MWRYYGMIKKKRLVKDSQGKTISISFDLEIKDCMLDTFLDKD